MILVALVFTGVQLSRCPVVDPMTSAAIYFLKGIGLIKGHRLMKFKGQDQEAKRTQAEREGIKIDFDYLKPGLYFICARPGGSNLRYNRVYQRELLKVRHRLGRLETGIDPALDLEINQRVYAEAVVLDWGGVENEKGQAVKYETDVAIEYFKAFPSHFENLRTILRSETIWEDEVIEEGKNDSTTP